MRRNFGVIYLCVVVNRMMFSYLNITEKNEIGFRVQRGSVDFWQNLFLGSGTFSQP